MSSGQAPKRRSSSIIERSQYAPAQPPSDDRRRKFESLEQDRAAIERAKQEMADISRQQGGRPSIRQDSARAAVQLDDLEVQQRKPLRMVVGSAPVPAPTSGADAVPQPADDTATPERQPPAAAPKKAQASAPAPASRAMFEHIEHQPAVSAAPTRSRAVAEGAVYPRGEHYALHDVEPYWEAPIALVRSNPLVLLLLAALVCGPLIWMFSQSPKTFISGYDGQEWRHTLGNVAKVFGGGNVPAYVFGNVEVPAGEHSILGQPSISVDQIEAVLTQYNSPARGSGAIWFALGQQYGIDPAYPLAFFIQESTAGTNSGWAGLKSGGGTTHNVGNIICAGYATCYKGNRDYPSWEAGIEDWYRLIAREYVEGRGLASVEQILPIYCPVSDGCRSHDYISIVNSMVDKWRQGQLFQ